MAVCSGDGGVRRREEEELAGDDGVDSAIERTADWSNAGRMTIVSGILGGSKDDDGV
jgi:hypothetical protein